LEVFLEGVTGDLDFLSFFLSFVFFAIIIAFVNLISQ